MLTEVHDEHEAHRAGRRRRIVGVNNRNLKTLAVSIETFASRRSHLAGARVRVAESGLQTGADLAALHAAGYGAFLIGERFMTDADPGVGLGKVILRCARGAGDADMTRIKMCGMTTVATH